MTVKELHAGCAFAPARIAFCTLFLAAAAFAEGPRTASSVAVQPPAETKRAEETAASDADETLLKEYQVTPTVESLRGCLQAMLPGSVSEKRQQTLIKQLGDDNYHIREAATKVLLQLPVVSSGLLTKAVQEGDPEVRWRAGMILRSAGRRSTDLLHAALQVISRRKLAGLAPEILATMHLCTTRTLQETASQALIITSGAADVARLRKHLDDPSRPVRVASLRALAKVQGPQSEPDLRRLSRDRDDVVRFEATVALLEQGRRDVLPLLGSLLESSELSVRVRAIQMLRAISGKRFAFVAYDEEPKRRESVQKWRNWIASNAKSVPLKFPLRLSTVEIGHTLVCDYQRNRVIELDAAWKIVWEHNVGTHPWACQGLPNGHRLVASYSTRAITEYDAKGKMVWGKTGLPGGPTSVQRLDNGHTLISCSDSQQVLEVDRKGDTVWSQTIQSRPTDARRLENGNTLVCLQNSSKVVEIDRGGKTVRELATGSSPFSAERLENGNTLVCCIGTGQVIEYDRDGKAVWTKTGLSSPYSAQRLANGKTLIATSTGLIEVDLKGTTTMVYSLRGISKFHRF